MKITVFGGSGFLGSYVADSLTQRGHDVTIFDLKRSDYLLPKKQKMVVGNILDEKAVSRAVKGADYVYNFAGIADLDDSRTKAMDTLHVNVAGNINILEAVKKSDLKRFIYASSIYVYSQKGGFYRCSKQASEIYIEEYNRRYGLLFTILRYGTLYGPRARGANSVFRYLQKAINDNCIVADGTGEELREYIHARDAAKLSVDILGKEFTNKHVIITGHHPMKFRDMLEMIKEISGKNIRIKFTGKENHDHYSITPYSFVPRIGDKLVSNCYTDMGQGLLECLHEMFKEKMG